MISRRSMLNRSICLALGLSPLAVVQAAPPTLRSGPQAGERPLPFTSNMVTGANRGRQFCYICELKDEPAVLVFARKPDEATGVLLQGLKEGVRTYRKDRLFVWMVFLSSPETGAQTAQERQVYTFARENGATELPISVLGDPQGPPGYLVAPDAEVTCLVFRSGKVVLNRAYRAKEWTPRAAESFLKEVPRAFGLKAGDKG